jgi:hypothetical protein
MLSSLVLQKEQLYLIVKTDAAQFCSSTGLFQAENWILKYF